MIYRHYKGGLYYLEGYAIEMPKLLHNSRKEHLLKAKYEKTLEEVDVSLIFDMNWNATFYTYESENIDGTMALYRGLNGQYWLRHKDDFHKKITVDNETMTRFEKVDGEYLFETIVDLMS